MSRGSVKCHAQIRAVPSPLAPHPSPSSPDAECRRECFSRLRRRFPGHFFRSAHGDDGPATRSAVGAEVNDPVGRLDHVEVVLDDEHRVAGIHESVQNLKKFLDIGEVESRCGLIEDVDRLAGRSFAEFPRQFDPLSLAARQRRRWLAEFQIVEPDVVQRFQQPMNLRDVHKMVEGFLHIHVEDVGDVFAFETDLERFMAEAFSLAHRAANPDVSEEIHFQFVRSVPLARLATTARNVEAEATWLVAADL